MSNSPKKSSRRLASVAVAAAPIACKDAPEYFRSFLEGTLPEAQEQQIRRHLETCPRCAHAIKDHQQLHTLLNETLGARALDRGFDERADRRLHERRALAAAGTTSARAITAMRLGIEAEDDEPVAAGAGGFLDSLQARLGAAPWWIISGAFHALLLLMLTLIGMALLRNNTSEVVIVSNLEKSPPPPEDEKEKVRDVFNKPVPVESDLPPVENPVVTH
ncbi:MAG: zf-HC2 domain-containing protein, partial [Planctomycetota bacterium]|nr:zf-HC2 domain-containing protein [Planctomycetota bacterium]